MWTTIKLTVVISILVVILAIANVVSLCEGNETCPSKSPETIQTLSEKLDIIITNQEANRKEDNEKYERNRKEDNEKHERNRKEDNEKHETNRKLYERNRKEDNEKYEANRKEDNEKYERNRKEDNEKYERNRKEDNEKYENDRKKLFHLLKGRQHDIQSEVAKYLYNVTVNIFDENTISYNSGHYIFYDQRFMLLSVSHGVQINGSFSCHTEIDVQISGGCPVNSAINVSNWAPLRTGDQASTLGFIYENDTFIDRFWKGSLAGKLGSLSIHNETKTRFLSDEYVFQGIAQLIGMSGGPTVNGIGYTGMVHGNNNYLSQTVSMACVIPFNLIKSECIDRMRNKKPALYAALKTQSECESANIIDTPQF